jgi:NADH:ubiquinone oxidoreductase subunit 2 (subunit N)
MLPLGTEQFTTFVFVLSVVAIIYTSLVALAQTDMKKMIAYSSVAHMGYVTMGVFTLNQQGMDGAIFQMLRGGGLTLSKLREALASTGIDAEDLKSAFQEFDQDGNGALDANELASMMASSRV